MKCPTTWYGPVPVTWRHRPVLDTSVMSELPSQWSDLTRSGGGYREPGAARVVLVRRWGPARFRCDCCPGIGLGPDCDGDETDFPSAVRPKVVSPAWHQLRLGAFSY